MKKTSQVYDGDKVVATIVDLPQGYFYKGKFYKNDRALFKVLSNEGVVGSSYFYNGTWEYKDKLYPSLQDVYDYNEDDFDITLSLLRRRYKDYGIVYNPLPCTRYFITDDDEKILYDSIGDVISEYKWDLSNPAILGDQEEVEELYMNNISGEELLSYCNLSVAKRIQILENCFKGGK